MKSILKSLTAILLVVTIVFGCVCMSTISAAEYLDVDACLFPRMGDQTYNPTGARIGIWGVDHNLVRSVFNNDMDGQVLFSGNLDFTNLYCLKQWNRPCYCIEPNTLLSKTYYTAYLHDEIAWGRISRYNNIMSASELEKIISLIVTYGYHGVYENMLTWNDAAGHEKIAQMFATQILVWEVAVKERDKEFNHLPIKNGSISVLKILDGADIWGTHGHHALYDKIMSYYYEIERNVMASLKLPSFCTSSPDYGNPYEISYLNGEYRLDLLDQNGVLGDYNISYNNENVTVTKNGNTLSLVAKRSFNDPVEVKFSASRNCLNVILWSDDNYGNRTGTQDLVSATEDSNTNSQTGYITVFCPHIHAFVSHRVEPTCTERGYMEFRCSCGALSTDDPITGVDTHTAAKGHDPDSPWIVSVPETCTEDGIKIQICDCCNAVLGSSPIPAHNHDSGVWKVDVEATPDVQQGQMTKYCTICGEALQTKSFSYHAHTLGRTETVKQASCLESGLSGKICATCGACYETSVVAPLGHTNADESVWTTTTASTCLAKGEETGYCARCGEKTGTRSIPALGHTTGTWITNVSATCTEDGESICACDRCGEIIDRKDIPATGHGNGKWLITTRPTCKTDGEKALICENCGATLDTEKVDATGHDAGVWSIKTSATCTEKGEKIRTCTACGKELESEKIPALGHEDGAWKVTVEPFCEEKGEKALICNRCNCAIDTEKIPALGHADSVWTVTTPATCTEKGEESYVCSRCGKATDAREIPAKGHGEKTWIINTKATCTADGEEIYVCSDCNAILEERALPKYGHDDGVTVISRPNGCTAEGEKVTTCTRCGEVIESEVVPPENHDDGVWKIDYAATMDHDGQRSLYCSKCGAVLQTETFTYHTHTFGYKKTIVEPTCNTKGEAGIFCKICDAQYETEEIDALEHDFSEIYTNNNGTHSRKCSICQYIDSESCTFETGTKGATCTTAGFTTYTCKVCGYSYQSGDVRALGHDWTKWVNDGNGDTHTRTCNRCNVTESAVHIWGEWRLVEKNVLDWTATYQRKCDFCGAIQKSTVKMADEPHAHKLEKVESVKPTCTKDGNSEYYYCTDPDCKCCFADAEGLVEVEKDSWIIPALGHENSNKWKVVKEATCTEKGFEESPCVRNDNGLTCDKMYTREIPPHDHNYVLKNHVDAGCDVDGYDYYECTYDPTHNYTDVIPGHKPVPLETEIPATCEKEGYYKNECAICGRVIYEYTIPALGHDYVLKNEIKPTCTESGSNYYECTRDPSHNFTEEVAPLGHDYHLISDKCKEATPEVPGYNYYECSRDSSHHYSKAVYVTSNTVENKKADFDEKSGIATITLDASAESKMVDVIDEEAKPVDVVLVLDTSGSMKEKKDGKKKIDSLKEAAKGFVNKVADNSEKNKIDNRIAIVDFSTEVSYYDTNGKSVRCFSYTPQSYTPGKSDPNTKTEKYENGLDYSAALISSKDYRSTIINAIDNLEAEGATRADVGMEIAERIIDKRVQTYDDNGKPINRKVIVIFITDGEPTKYNSFDKEGVAVPAVTHAYNLKNKYHATVYSVGFDIKQDSRDNMSGFMNAVSSYYPGAVGIERNQLGEADSPEYSVDVSNSEGLNIVFDTIYRKVVQPAKSFDDITIFDTISKEFTMTYIQEKEFREDVAEKYGKNAEVTVVRNEDGTTSVTVKHLEPKKETDADRTYFYVSVTFSVSANKYAQGKSYYNTNTGDAGVVIDGSLVSKFTSPKVVLPDERYVVAFLIDGDYYVIEAHNEGDEILPPSVADVTWNVPDDFKVSDYYTEFTGTRTTPERTITWIADGKETTEKYKVGQRINVYNDTKNPILGWDKQIPFTMPDEDLTFTAQYPEDNHVHVFKQVGQYGTCTEGITYIQACKCGYTYEVKSNDTSSKHELTARICNYNDLSFARVTCSKCGYVDEKYITFQAEYNDETILDNGHGNTGTNQIVDLTMYNAENVSVQPDGNIEIIIPVTSQMLHDENLRIFRINDDGTKDEIEFVKNDNADTITMTIDHFSYYMISASGAYEAKKTPAAAECAFTKGHKYEFRTIEPTCTSLGKTAYICEYCGDFYGEEYIPAKLHVDADHDGFCDECGTNIDVPKCNHMCHSDKWCVKILWKILNFFNKLFGIKQECECGAKHY